MMFKYLVLFDVKLNLKKQVKVIRSYKKADITDQVDQMISKLKRHNANEFIQYKTTKATI